MITFEIPVRKELIIAAQDLLRELMALEADYVLRKICFFRPLPQGDQKNFFNGQDHVVRLVMGDNRSGKSESGATEAIAHALGYRPWLAPDDPNRIVRLPGGKPIPVPNVGRIVAQDFQQAIRQNIWPKFLDYAPKGWYKVRYDNQKIPKEVEFSNGSKIYFMSAEQNIDVFEGTKGHWFWVDEPIPQQIYTALRRGLVDTRGHCWLTLTPLSQAWIADVIEERAGDPDGEVGVYEFSIWDNCDEVGGHLTREAIESFIRDLPEHEKAVRVGHQWGHLTGRIFKEWQPRVPYWIEPFAIPDTWPRVTVIDPHPRKPIAVMWMAFSPEGQRFVYRELFDEDLLTVHDVAEKMKELEKDEVVVARFIDPASQEVERTSGDSVFRRFHREGIRCQLAKKKNIAAGLDAIHEELKMKGDWQEPGLVVFNMCPTVKKNFQRFCWDDWGSAKKRDVMGDKEEVRKVDDDFIACIRYTYAMNLSFPMLRQGIPRAQREKDPEIMDRGYNLHTGQYYGSTQ